MRFDLSPGINYVLTNDKKSIQYGDFTQESRIQFVKYNKLNYFTQVNISIETQMTKKFSIVYFLGYQRQLTPLYRIKSSVFSFNEFGNPIYPHYLSMGICLRYASQKIQLPDK